MSTGTPIRVKGWLSKKEWVKKIRSNMGFFFWTQYTIKAFIPCVLHGTHKVHFVLKWRRFLWTLCRPRPELDNKLMSWYKQKHSCNLFAATELFLFLINCDLQLRTFILKSSQHSRQDTPAPDNWQHLSTNWGMKKEIKQENKSL